VKVLYVVATGAGDPTRASLLLHLAANGSVESGQECALALIGDGSELSFRETVDAVEGVGVPTARDLIKKLVDNAVPVYV
jgi:predicted peroxiredoxin